MSWKTIIFTYVLGGLTLPPLLILGALYILFVVHANKEIQDGRGAGAADDDLSDFAIDEYQALKLTEIEEKHTTGVNAFRAGWLTVTREYHPFISNASDKQLEEKNPENKSAYTTLYKLVKNTASKKLDINSNNKTNNRECGEAQDLPVKQANPNQAVSKAVRRKNRYYGVLRHGNLFLYKDETKKDVQHVIVLSKNVVTIWPRDLKDAELFTKKSAICVLKKSPRRKSDLPPKTSPAALSHDQQGADSTINILENGILPPKHMGFFIYPDTNYEKEDWYFDLIKATKRDIVELSGGEFDKVEPTIYANPLHFKTADIISLIQTLHSSEGQLQTRWLNAIVGRIFLSLQQTKYFETVIRNRLLKKLDKINKPGFLDDFQIKKIDVGDSSPFISSPRLIELNPDGSTRVGFNFLYKGKISLQVSTTATINLGGAFKAREVSLLLAVTLNRLEGPMILSVKPPPSSRLWYAFEEMPDIDLTVEPVVSQRQFSYSMINKVIENKLRGAVKDSIVLPFWDDISFFNTGDEFYRGGIWDTKMRPEEESDTHHVNQQEKDDFLNEYVVDDDDAITFSGMDTLNSDITAAGRAVTSGDEGSLRDNQTVRSRTSFNNLKKKSEPHLGTSNDQFLSNGSYVSTPTPDNLEKPTRSNTMQILSEEASAGKKTISNGLKKIGKWYSDKNKSSVSLASPKPTETSYKPPEMISKRRTPSNTSSDSHPKPKQQDSSSDLKEVKSNDGDSSKHAPQAHSFPPEYLYGLETKQPDEERDTKNHQPSRVPEMKVPLSCETTTSKADAEMLSTSPSTPKKVEYPKRKPVALSTSDEEDILSEKILSEGQQELVETTVIPPKLPPRENMPKLQPPTLPTRKAPTSSDSKDRSQVPNSISPSEPLGLPLTDVHPYELLKSSSLDRENRTQEKKEIQLEKEPSWSEEKSQEQKTGTDEEISADNKEIELTG